MPKDKAYYVKHFPTHVSAKRNKTGFALFRKSRADPAVFLSPFDKCVNSDLRNMWFQRFHKLEKQGELHKLPQLVYLYGEPEAKSFAFVADASTVLYKDASKGKFRKAREFMNLLRNKMLRKIPLVNDMELKYAHCVREFFEDLQAEQKEDSSSEESEEEDIEEEDKKESNAGERKNYATDTDDDVSTVVEESDLDYEMRRAQEELNAVERDYKRARIEFFRESAKKLAEKTQALRDETAEIAKSE